MKKSKILILLKTRFFEEIPPFLFKKFPRLGVLILLIIATVTSSCVTTNLTDVPNSTTISSVEKDRIEILGNAEGKAVGVRVWVLFIPLGWGQDARCKKYAYKNALKQYPKTDGLLDQKMNYYRFRVPLIAVTPVVKKVTVTGVAYHIRTDSELQEYLKSKK